MQFSTDTALALQPDPLCGTVTEVTWLHVSIPGGVPQLLDGGVRRHTEAPLGLGRRISAGGKAKFISCSHSPRQDGVRCTLLKVFCLVDRRRRATEVVLYIGLHSQ